MIKHAKARKIRRAINIPIERDFANCSIIPLIPRASDAVPDSNLGGGKTSEPTAGIC